MRKDLYPEDYDDSMAKLDKRRLPPEEAFYSKLTGEGIKDEDYQYAQTVLEEFNIASMKNFHNL